MLSKKEIRAEMKRRESAFSLSDAAVAEVWAPVEVGAEFAAAHTVLVYMDIPGEVPTLDFIERWRGAKRILIPLVVGEDLELCEYDPSHLVEGYKGIMEPSADARRVPPSEVDLALVPGVAFCERDGRLWRLGRGKGFYDRLMPRMACPKFGIYFPFRLVDELPLDPWDQPLQIMTQNG